MWVYIDKPSEMISMFENAYKTLISGISEFLRLESAGGIMLMIAMVLAMVLRNSPLAGLYTDFLNIPVVIQFGALEINKPLLLWINDGLMALFFFMVGLELKREILQGELANPAQITLPLMGAIGGMVIPAAIYAFLNMDDAIALQGWAIPAATDIAFALGILMLLGKRVPTSLKIFLMTLAVLDDIGAIVIIALFYTADLSILSLSVAGSALFILILMNRFGNARIAAYVIVGLVMWVSVLKSGVHATLAGVALAFTIPMCDKKRPDYSPLRRMEEDLHPSVVYFVLPLFAFANTGVSFDKFTSESLQHPVPLGIALGLFIGKQVGVFGFSWLVIKLGIAKKPQDMSWLALYGVALLCGIGFTMSLFIGSLAFEHGGLPTHIDKRVGVLMGSLFSALCGYMVLRYALYKDTS